MLGSEVLSFILGKTGSIRENILLDLFLVQKAIPAFFLEFLPVHATGNIPGRGNVDIKYQVSPDYLCLGEDSSFLRIPLMPSTAQKVADHFNSILPTKRMVDQIYNAAFVKLSPMPYQPKAGMPGREDSRTFSVHNIQIQAQLAARGTQGLIVAGHKKDLVITNQLLTNPKKVAIYGWHEMSGKPIQPLFLGHGDFYVDYSHGIRLVSKVCWVNGLEADIEEVLKDKDLADLLTGSGPLKVTRYKV